MGTSPRHLHKQPSFAATRFDSSSPPRSPPPLRPQVLRSLTPRPTLFQHRPIPASATPPAALTSVLHLNHLTLNTTAPFSPCLLTPSPLRQSPSRPPPPRRPALLQQPLSPSPTSLAMPTPSSPPLALSSSPFAPSSPPRRQASSLARLARTSLTSERRPA